MRIEWIEVENFKGFDKRRFEFDEHFTLIVGENGTGKTSLIDSISLILGAWTQAAINSTYSLPTGLVRMVGRMIGPAVVVEPAFPLCMTVKIAGLSQAVEERFSVASEEPVDLGRALHQFYEAFKDQIKAMLESTDTVAPLCVTFPASRRVDSAARPDFNTALASLPRRTDGYENWNNPAASSQKLAEWLMRWQAVSEEDKSESPIFRTTREAIIRACPDLKQIRFSTKRGRPVVERISGEVVEFSRLSDGQKSVLAMIGDIARRCALLNPQLHQPASETPGVVLIDEIDLHLHPRWQRRIMEDLTRVFPKIQFIATTHSPIIISAAKDAKVILLEENGSREVPQAYGMDVNWVVEAIQGAEPQAGEVTKLVRKVEDLIEEGKLEEARKLIPSLERMQNGPSPDSVRLTAEIDNLLALAHAED